MIINRFVSCALAILAMLALGLTVLSVSSCKRKGTEIPVTGVTVSQPTITLTEGGTATISYTVEPSDASVKDVTFSSSDTGVATVDESGRVTAVGPGTATITVTTKDGGFKATVTVTVTAKDTPPGPPEPPTPGDVEVTGITLDKTSITLKVGGTETITATVLPEDAKDKSLYWKIDKTSVAIVDDDGKVSAMGVGSATITVTSKSNPKVSAKCDVTVVSKDIAVTGITLNKTTLDMYVGGTETLTATVEPDNATDKALEWKSSKSSVAIVGDDGKVSAMGVGSATITVTSKSNPKVSAKCELTVSVPALELRTIFLEDKGSYNTFGNVIHYKYGTNYRGSANNFLVVPWDAANNKLVQDPDASHYSCSSSRTADVTVTVENLGSRCAFCVKAAKELNAWSNLEFTYNGAGGSKATAKTRLVIAPAAAPSAFDYALYAVVGSGSPDIASGSYEYTIPSAADANYMRLFTKFNAGSGGALRENKEMASYIWSTSNTSVVAIKDELMNDSGEGVPYPELSYKGPGTSTVRYTYTDYKGNKLDKTIKFTVKKGYFDSADYISDVSGENFNSSSNPYEMGQNEVKTFYIFNGSTKKAYEEQDLTGFTWSSSNTSVASVYGDGSGNSHVAIRANGPGSVTITGKAPNGSQKQFYIVVRAAVTGYPYVLMGDGLKWATKNVGASQPHEYGNYYAWGETKPKSTYTAKNYKFNPSGDGKTFTKYSGSGTSLDLSDDAARQNWGGTWRMPKQEEWGKLTNPSNFTWTWTANYNGTGVAGMIVTSKVSGYVGNSIFLPAAGYCLDTSHAIYTKEEASYWSTMYELEESFDFKGAGYYLLFYASKVSANYIMGRYIGASVRAVSD